MMTSYSNVLIFIVFVSSICNTFAWSDCGNAFNTDVPRFTQFALFPNPVQVGEIVHARAVVSIAATAISGAITDGRMTLLLTLNGVHTMTVPQISLCDSTTAIACETLDAGDNAFSFDFRLPQIPAGTYTVQLNVAAVGISQTGCLNFDVKVVDPASQSVYASWVEATLAGVAQFSDDDIQKREYGDLIQVGPVGPVSSVVGYQWGTFINIVGSQDVLGVDFSPVGYVWGLYGNMTELQYNGGFKEKQTYTGTFYIGYVSSLTKRALDTEIAEGDFKLTWTFSKDSNGAIISKLVGNIYFDTPPVVPKGWGAPVALERLGPYSLKTNDAGIIIVQATKKYCLTAEPCDFDGIGAAPGNEGLSDNDIAIMVALLVGIPLIAALIGATLLFLRHRRRNEEEAGIFSAARKPEYGNALVIDDIIQESREHNGSVLPPLYRRAEDSYEYSDDDEDETSELNSPRSPGRGAKSPVYSDDDLRSPGRSTSRSRGKARSDSDSYDSD